MKKVGNLIFSRLVIGLLAMFLQFAWMVLVVYKFSVKYTFLNMVLQIIALIVVLSIVYKWNNPVYKVSWIFLILFSPLLGITTYFIFGRSELTKKTKERMERANNEVVGYLEEKEEVKQRLKEENLSAYNQSNYISDYAKFPLYTNTKTRYYKSGEEMFEVMLEDLKKAEQFIFLEYFIIEPGIMFDQMVSILEEKVKNGVDVRLIYDDVGCINTLPHQYAKLLEEKGIKCAAFNPFLPFLSIIMNNRDHRKILVVDGNIGYTGGINLADEYINQKERFGYWKDTGVRLEGEGVWSLTNMFLGMWNYIKHSTEDYEQYKPKKIENFTENGYVQPYGDSPLDHEYVGENVYLNIINKAKKYVYIFTPYLITDNEMLTSLGNAAKSGVDVRIVTPGIPDKKLVYLLTQSYYEPLLKNGVKIYQYEPGFIHAKCFVCDDEIATVGTINLDFRSLYLHFECGVWMYQTESVMQVKEDALDTFEKSEEVPLEFCLNRNIVVRFMQSILRLFAPLL